MNYALSPAENTRMTTSLAQAMATLGPEKFQASRPEYPHLLTLGGGLPAPSDSGEFCFLSSFNPSLFAFP